MTQTPTSPKTSPAEPVRFGTFQGVYLPSVLTVLGVIMYLRLGWVVGQTGLAGTLLIIALASSITFLTGLSISATATNMHVGAGGAYYMISRAFGAEVGAAIGWPLFLAQAFGISFYLAGFAESFRSMAPGLDPLLPALAALVVLGILSVISADLALKFQLLIFGMIALSVVSFFLGKPLPLAAEGPPAAAFPELPFWTVFAVFFPAVTGILSGLGMSGDLKNPSRSLPVGTLGAVLTGFFLYSAMAWVLSGRADASILLGDSLVMERTSWLPQAFYAGLWGATLSSALGSMLAAPRTLQAMARDGVAPRWLAQAGAADRIPRWATSATLLLACGGLFLGGLNVIAPVLSMFFLTSYGMLNLSAGLESLIGNPSWRPKFKVPWPASLVGAAACLSAMFLIEAWATLSALALIGLLFWWLARGNRRPRWFDFRRSIVTFLARQTIYSLDRYEKNPRNWRPNLLVLSGSPTHRWYLIELADAITHGQGFLTVAAILPNIRPDHERIENMEAAIRDLLNQRGIPALVEMAESEDFLSGARGLVRHYGLGPLTPNTLVLGESEREESRLEFAKWMRLVHAHGKNLLLVREGAEPADLKTRNRRIDVWWGGRSDNNGLMLALAYMIQTSPEWRHSRLLLRRLVYDPSTAPEEARSLREFLKVGQLHLEYDVQSCAPDQEPFQRMRELSRDADLVFLGIKAPGDDEKDEEYAAYYGSLLEQSKGFPLTVLTLAGEKVDFREIFLLGTGETSVKLSHKPTNGAKT